MDLSQEGMSKEEKRKDDLAYLKALLARPDNRTKEQKEIKVSDKDPIKIDKNLKRIIKF